MTALILMLNTSNDVVSCKDLPFKGPETNLYILTPFSQKMSILGAFLDGALENFWLKIRLNIVSS